MYQGDYEWKTFYEFLRHLLKAIGTGGVHLPATCRNPHISMKHGRGQYHTTREATEGSTSSWLDVPWSLQGSHQSFPPYHQ